jgi:ferredoxin
MTPSATTRCQASPNNLSQTFLVLPQSGHGVRRLRPEDPVGATDAACLAYRFAASPCRACITACPTGALAIDVGSRQVMLNGECRHCGRCQAACPTGALRVSGFADRQDDDTPAQALQVRCWKSPRHTGDGASRTVRVPCLHGLSDARIAAMVAASLPQPMTLIDHGWCGQCDAAGGVRLADRLAAACTTLRAAGLDDAQLPRIESQPVPVAAMPKRIPDAAADRPMGRRAFFAGLVRETLVPSAVAATAREGDSVATIRTEAIAGGRRSALLAALARISRASGGQGITSLPPALFPRLLATDCCESGVCVAHCPTGALTRVEAESLSGAEPATELRFDTLACIGCGHCVAACPESALAFDAQPGYQSVTTLARFALRRCDECGARLSAREEELSTSLCGHCFKSRRLARSAFSQLFGARG